MNGLATCAVCGSDRRKSFLLEGSWKTVTCGECGHLYTSNLPEAHSSSYLDSKGWIKQQDPHQPTAADHRYLRHIEELTRLKPDRGSILDIGCSIGRFLVLMAERGWIVHGVEPGMDGLVAAQALGEEAVHRELYDQILPIEFDVVTAFEVLEHIPEPDRTVERIKQQLKPGGYFMGSIPNGDFVRLKVLPKRYFGISRLVVPLILDAGNHINYFSASGLSRMLHRKGFRMVWIRHAPLDLNYLANRLSPFLKLPWYLCAELIRSSTGRYIGSNLWFLAQKPTEQ